MTDRTEEIRARVESELGFRVEDNGLRTHGVALWNALITAREEVERLKGALDLIQLNSSCDCDEEFCAKHKAIEALSPSPAQQEGK